LEKLTKLGFPFFQRRAHLFDVRASLIYPDKSACDGGVREIFLGRGYLDADFLPPRCKRPAEIVQAKVRAYAHG